MGAAIRKIEYVFPKNLITNRDLADKFKDYDFENFEKKVGIRNRYIVSEDETALSLAVEACEKLFLSVDRNEIDFLLYCTQSPEYLLPTTACMLQDILKLNKSIGSLDFNLGCSGYTYGVSLAKGLINSGQAKKVLLVTAETYSKFINPLDRSNLSIFGDAATATLIEFSEIEQLGSFLYGSDGSGYDKLIVKNGGARFSYDINAHVKEYGTGNKYTDNDLYMNGPDIFTFTTEVIPPFVADVMLRNDMQNDKVDQFVFHQANAFMLNFLRKKMKIDADRFYINLADGGNTVSCTIPIALKRYSQQLKKEKETIMIVGFGVGLSWCGGIVEISNSL